MFIASIFSLLSLTVSGLFAISCNECVHLYSGTLPSSVSKTILNCSTHVRRVTHFQTLHQPCEFCYKYDSYEVGSYNYTLFSCASTTAKTTIEATANSSSGKIQVTFCSTDFCNSAIPVSNKTIKPVSCYECVVIRAGSRPSSVSSVVPTCGIHFNTRIVNRESNHTFCQYCFRKDVYLKGSYDYTVYSCVSAHGVGIVKQTVKEDNTKFALSRKEGAVTAEFCNTSLCFHGGSSSPMPRITCYQCIRENVGVKPTVLSLIPNCPARLAEPYITQRFQICNYCMRQEAFHYPYYDFTYLSCVTENDKYLLQNRLESIRNLYSRAFDARVQFCASDYCNSAIAITPFPITVISIVSAIFYINSV